MLRELDGLGDGVRMGSGEHLSDAAGVRLGAGKETVIGAVRVAVIADCCGEETDVIGGRLRSAFAQDLEEPAVLRVAEVLGADLRGEDLEGLPAAQHNLGKDRGLHLL